jgi:tRNA G10  N-methylase Trm11
MAEGSLSNMNAFGQTWLGVIRADAFSLPLIEVDGVATDIPYGRASSTGGMTSRAVMDFVVERLPAVLKDGSRLVIMHPSQLHVGSSTELDVEEEHYIYIHRKLTRAITILRKT